MKKEMTPTNKELIYSIAKTIILICDIKYKELLRSRDYELVATSSTPTHDNVLTFKLENSIIDIEDKTTGKKHRRLSTSLNLKAVDFNNIKITEYNSHLFYYVPTLESVSKISISKTAADIVSCFSKANITSKDLVSFLAGFQVALIDV